MGFHVGNFTSHWTRGERIVDGWRAMRSRKAKPMITGVSTTSRNAAVPFRARVLKVPTNTSVPIPPLSQSAS
jgi:hypothetical protein